MADPLNPETELNTSSLPQEGQQEIDALFAPAGMTPDQEINSLFSGPSSNLAQASHLISIRDNPKALDPILGTKDRLMAGTLPFNQQSWQDAQKNVNDYIKSTSQATIDAEKKNDWMTLSKIALGGVGKVIGSYLQSGLGITNEEAQAAQESMASRMYVGSITDPVDAGKALNYGSFFTDELASGKQIVPKDQKPAMAFGTGAMYTPKIGMNLAMAQEYLQDLQSDKNKTLGTAGLRNFAIKSGDAFLPFVSVGDIVVDENNPEDVGRRAALTTAINDVVQKDYLGSTIAGAAAGSLGQFMLAGAGATGLLGKAATIAEDTVKVPSILSKGATYAVVGTSQSFKEDPRNLSFGQRLASAISNAATLAVSEEAGNKLENALDHSLANHMVAKALSDRIPSLTPVLEGTAKVVGTTIGESSSDFIQAIMQGQDPIAQLPESLAASGGIGLGMTLLEGLAGRRAKISKQGNDMLADSLLKTINETKKDTNLSEEQKASQLAELRTKLGTPEAQNLFDAVNVASGLDASVAPETTKVAQEAVEKAKQNALESMLQQKISQKEGQIGTPATFETKAPETEEEKISALNELIGVFEKGATSINLDNTPENASKIQWLESQGRVVGELSEDGKTYSIKNVKTDAGTWLNGTPAIEFQQDLKDQFMVRAEEIGLEQDELDQMNSEFEKAGTDQEVEDVARKYLGPTDYEVALESKLAKSQDLVAEEKPAEINAQKLQAQISALENVIKQSPSEEVPALQEQLNSLKAMQVEGQIARVARGEKSVSDLVQQFESETEKEVRSGKLAPELEARPDIILPINNPESESYQKYQKLKPDSRENSKADLGNVFNLKNPATVELLQSLGAIDEQGRNVMSPAEALVAYVTRKYSYLQSKSLAGYQKYNIADEVAGATVNSFLYELRQGKTNLSLSTIFNSRLRDFIRRAVPRMRAGVGLGAAVSLETPGLRVNAVDAETLAEEQGINPAVAGAINEALDQIDATEIDNQIENPSNVPSQAQRQEALSVIAQNSVAPFRESLATDAEKLAFDSLVSGKSATAQDAAKIGTTIDNINALKSAVKLKFVANLEAQYRVAQQANALPSREVAEPEGVVKAGNLTYQQIKPFEDLFKKYQADSMFDDTELENAKALLDQVRGTRSAQMLRAFESYISNVASDKISPDAITELAEAIDQNIKDGVEEGSLSQKQGQDYIDKLNKLAEPYLASQNMEEGEAKDKIAISFRSNLLTVSDKIAEDRGFTVTEEGINEQPTTEPTVKPEVKTTADRRAEASQNFAKNEEKRTPPTKRVSQETVSGQRKEVGPSVGDKTTGTGRPGVERARGTPIPKSFVESRNQLGKPYNEKVLDPLGQQTLNLLSPEQKQDVAAAVTTIESSKHKAFYLANGPGTGKTRVLLATAKYYLDKGFNVFYLTAPDAVTPDWDAGKIGGSIEKDARLMGVPIVARGGKGTSGRGLPIEKIPGSVVVSTYTSQYLEKLIPLVDAKTVVLFDEQHAGRNLHKAIQEGKGRAWSILMDEISKKAGRVMMASGTPFETPDQLLSLGRLGIFDTESPDALIKRLGFEKQYLRGGKKSYWTLAPGVTEGEMQDRLEAYLDGLVKNGILRTRSLKLDGVNVEFQDVPLDAAIIKQLEDIKNMYGGMQNNDISALRKMVAAQKRALEEYKVDAAAKRAIQSIRRGRKPIIYVGFVSEVNSKGQAVDPTSAAVEAAILKLAPELKIARMYTGSDQTKEQALAAFNEGGFDVLIATKEMGGTGIELDDKFGDEPRDMIIMSAPVSAIQAVQLVYRVWRTDSASRPNLIFLESKAEVDQQNIDRMRAKLRLLDATTGAGFEGLKAEEVKPTEVVAPVRSEAKPTPGQVSTTEQTIQSVLGKDYSNNVITFRDSKGEARTYNVKIAPDFQHMAAAMIGTDNESDTIIINPDKLEQAKKDLSPEAFKSYLTKVMIEETIHVETFRYFRELGLDPAEEISAIGESLSQAARLAIARLYYSSLGSDITNPSVQTEIKALANNPYWVAMEGIRQLSQLNLTGGITEQVSSANAQDIERATNRLKDLIGQEDKSVLARLGVWFDSMATVIKRGLGLAPNARDRLAMRQSIEDAISNLRKTSKKFMDASSEGPGPVPAPGTSPSSPRPSNTFDSYDLRIYRMIENHLEGKTDNVLGVTVADDMFKTVGVEEWLNALDMYTRRGAITQAERTLFRDATRAMMDGQRVSLPGMANKALEIAENNEAAGKSIPVEALVATSAPAEVTTTKQNYVAQPTYREYRVKIPGQLGAETKAVSEAKATANVVSRLFDNQEVVNYNGQRYTSPGALIAALRDAGYAKFAKPIPAPAPAPEVRESKAVKSLATKMIDALPQSAITDLVKNTWYQSTPREQQFADAKDYIAGQNNEQKVIAQFLGGTIKGPLPLQGAIGFELVKSLGPKAKTDLFAKQQLVDVMLVLSKRYGTEAGQTIDLWNALNELSSNPEAMKMFIAKQIDTSVKGRLKGYKTEEEDIATGLKDASRRATEKLTTDSSTKNIISKIAKLVDLNKRAATVAQLEAALAEYVESDQAVADGKEFLGADLAAAPEAAGSDADNIRLDPKQTKALSRMIIEIIQRSENPSVTAASEDQIKALLLLTPALRDAKNQDDVRRKLDLYFDAALANALETYSAKALGDARAREGIEPPVTRGEAGRRVEEAKAKAKAKAPISIEQGVGDGSIDHALLDAAADSLQRQAERLQKELKVKGPMEVLVARIKSYIATNTKAEGGLQPAYVPLAKPTEAEVFKDLVDQYPTVMEVFNGIRDSLKDNFSDEELIGLEPFIEEVFNNPFTESSLKRTIRSLESIGGPKTNIQGLIRASKGDIMTFENELGALLTKNTTLDAAQQKEVKDFLREKLASLIASERKQELERIKKRFEAKKERKTRKMRSALDKLIEATNLGVLNDPEVFMQMHSQLGLPMLKDSERAHLNQLIEALPLYPAGMIRNRKVSEMYQYVKLVSPQVWGELLVNYQTSNLLAGVGTIGVNAWSAFVTNELNAGILASVGAVKGLAGDKATAKAYKDGAMALNAAIFAGEKPALTAAQNIFFKGDYSSVQDALTQELGGVNIWEAIVKQAEDYRAGKPGTARPELPVNVFGEEYRIPLDSKYLSSKYGALAPFIFFGRAMAAGDAINKISSRKMYEIAEATNIAIAKGLTSTEEIDREVARLLNQSPEARKRAEAKAESEAKEFNLTPEQQSLRVEEILEQGRPDEEEVKNLIEKSKKFAAQTTFTNDFEGWFGLLADGLTTISSKAWPLRLVIKFLKTGSSLANEILNFMPGISTARLLWGSGAGLGDTKYYRPPAVPGTVEHDLLLGKMTLGYILTATLLAALREAMSGEDDPHFNLHFKGPSDPAQREAFFAAGGKLRSIQIGRFRDGKPMFLSFEGLPVGLSGPLLLSAAINETVRYEKRSKAESILLGAMTGGALAMYGVMDIAALSGIRQIMSLTSPGVGQRDAMGIMTNLSKTVGNIAGGLIPGYATLRDIEQLFDGIMGAPSGRPYQENLLSTFAQSVPFASKVGKRDLDFLGGNNKTQLANTVPFLRRLTTSGVDSKVYDNGERTPEAVHDKLISLFAANRASLDWSAGPLKDFAMMDLMKEKQARGEPVSVDDFYQLKRELSSAEKYEWLQRAGPIVQQQLGSIIPDLEKMSRVEFVTIVPQIVNPIKKAILFQILSEKNQQDVLYPERQ